MPNPKLSTLTEPFNASTLNTSLWNSITGTATLDTTVDLVTLSQPTTSGATNSFGSTNLYDATSSSVFALITAVANGNGNTKTALVLRVDANNSVALRVESGVLKFTLQTAGTTATTTLGAYNGHTHRWWRLREAAGTWYADTSVDGITWTSQTSSSYSWAATAMTFAFQTSAGATEVAGLTASISCINVRVAPVNLNWPVIEEAWGPYFPVSTAVNTGRLVDVTSRAIGTSSIQRGRQYELDQVRSGELNSTLVNTDGTLDPTNASGPYAGNILPYQPYRKRAQWPPTVNVLSQLIATGADLGGLGAGATLANTGSDILSDTDSSSGTVTASASAWQGSTVMQFSVPNATPTLSRIFHTPQPAAQPGQTYTLQMRVRNVTASTSLQVKPSLGWYATPQGSPTYFLGSTATLTGSPTAAWTLLTYAFTVPPGSLGMSAALTVAATAGAACSIQIDGVQIERGATATAWVTPGAWYPMYAGYAERWPSAWRDGVYGTVAPTAVDAFALLSQVTLSDPLTQELVSRNPRFLFKLDDPQGSLSASDWTGTYGPAPLAISKYGAGALTFGNQIASATPGGSYSGSAGTVVSVDNPYPGQSLVAPATFIKLTSTGIAGPIDPTAWVRFIAFRYTGPTIATFSHFWSCVDGQRNGGISGSRIFVFLDNSGRPTVAMNGPTGAGASFPAGGATNCMDGNWHFLLFGYNQSTQQVMVSQDGATASYYGSIPNSYAPTGLISDNLGAFVDPTVGDGTTNNFKGDLAFAGEFGTWIATAAGITNLYQAWKNAFAGESTDARYNRILGYAGWPGPTAVSVGLTTSMGAADIAGQDALSALQGVVDTEGGSHYVARDGAITFRARSARYNALTPVYAFGERADLGEYPYEDCKVDFDPTRLSNTVTVTQKGTGQTFAAQDQASIKAYFPRPLTRTVNATSTAECWDAANYLLSRYKQPVTRISSLKLHPSAQPALWPVLLGMELGTRVRIMRRPPGVPAIQIDVFVESIGWQMDDRGEAFVTLQCSPADLTPYGLFAAWHTTLKTTVSSGVTSITVNASQDNTNPLAAQLAAGTQIVLGQNTANQETVTVSAVGATTTGWTSAVITLTAATTKGHTAGDLINEVLPAGTTDPTTWDTVSAFDSNAFAY
ncbi:hypothetical protein ACFXJO_05385 [Streptomyces lavendulae]|uniref:hypothetical protein n=1 Tax=Streptomyces lavendulae TaxID=1914 RepID=UPI0036B24511